MTNARNITLYGNDRDALQEAKTALQDSFPSYFNYGDATITDDYVQPTDASPKPAIFALRLEFASAHARNALGISTQVSGSIKRKTGFDVERLTDVGNQIRYKI